MLKGAVLGVGFMALAAWSSTPGAQSLHPAEPAILYYVSFPLSSGRGIVHQPAFGFAIHGRHASEVVRVDSRWFRLSGSEAFDVKWALVGAVAAGAALAAAATAANEPNGPSAESPAPSACKARPTC